MDSTLLDKLKLPKSEDEVLYQRFARERFAKSLPDAVTISFLVRRSGASRTVVTRALQRISEEWLVERASGQLWTFRPALNDPETYDRSYAIRLVVEPAALETPEFAPDPKRAAHLPRIHESLARGAVHRTDAGRLFDVDAEFHEAIGAWSGNPFLEQAVRQQTRLRHLSEYESYGERTRLRQSCLKHLAILDAIADGKPKRAATVMIRHIEVSRDVRPMFADNE